VQIVVTPTGAAANLGLQPATVTAHMRAATGSCADTTYPSVPGLSTLCPLPASTDGSYVLTGGTDNYGTGARHPGNHYGSTLFNGRIQKIAKAWSAIPYVGTLPPLAINDMSLIDGGLFDFTPNWLPSLRKADVSSCSTSAGKGAAVYLLPSSWCGPAHKTHRWGDAADIGSGSTAAGTAPPGFAYWIPPSQRATLLSIIHQNHAFVVKEQQDPGYCNPQANPNTPCNHWHVQSIDTNYQQSPKGN
jgi:hypothetical protein